MARLQTEYKEKVAGALQEQFSYKSSMEVPKITKITLNMGLGSATNDKKVVESAVADMEQIAGQKAMVTKARISEAGFKLREGMPIGCKVTLRGERMYEFLDRLINVAMPRIRDFRGVSSKGFDGQGNFNMGIQEQIIFPEIDYDNVDVVRGMNISLTTTAKTNEEGLALLQQFNFPFKK